MPRVIAARHGETDWNRNGRMQGWAPIPLNQTGRKQAAALGEWLADAYTVDRIVASDLLRTRQTVEQVRDSLGDLDVTYERCWRERHLGVYQGLTYTDIEERFPEFGLGESAREAALSVPESGESLRDVADRVTGRFNDLITQPTDETVLVVTHGGPLHILTGYVKGLSLRDALNTTHQGNCAVNEFLIADESVDVIEENATAWDD